MVVVIIKTFVYIIAIMLWMHTILWLACEVKKEDTLDGMNYFELKAEVEMLQKARSKRIKKKSMEPMKGEDDGNNK